MKLPISLTAEFRGLGRTAGSFVNEAGVEVTYPEAYRFEIQQPDGTLDDVSIGVKVLDEACDFDVSKLAPGDYVHIEGTVGAGDRGLYLRPSQVRKATRPQAVAS